VRSATVKDKRATFTWNGKDAGGDIVPDGKYRLTLWVGDASDNRSSKAWTVTVDTKRPTVTTTAEEGDFSPDGNGFDDYMTLTWASSQDIHGTVRMLDAAGTSRRLWKFGDRRSWKTDWDGRDDGGAKLPNGTYTYRVNGRDRAGNLRIVDRAVLIDDTIKLHRWSDYSFDPRDGEKTRMTVTLRRSASSLTSDIISPTGDDRFETTTAKLTATAYGSTSWTRTVTVQVH